MSEERSVAIEIPATVELVTVVRMIVAAACTAGHALEGDRLDDLRWVTSEAVTNAIQANLAAIDEENPNRGRVKIEMEVGADQVRLKVTDQGEGLPDEISVPDIEHPDRLHIEGGFGIPLMRHLTRGAIEFHVTPDGTTVDLTIDR